MLVTAISGNLNDLSDQERQSLTIDPVHFDNETRLKRVQRTKTASGEEIALRFDNDFRELFDGDILYRDGNKVIAAKIDPTDVLVISPRDIREALVVAHTLGNRHMQAQFFDENSQFGETVMVVRYDHTTEHYLEHVEVPFKRGDYVMPKAFRHAEHTH